MAVPAAGSRIGSLLLDIEGTTTPVDFVYQVLFPYARNHVGQFIRQQQSSEEVRSDIVRLREEHASDVGRKLEPPAWRDDSVDSQMESVAGYVFWLMNQDRKSTGLKSLQGKIWEAGYRAGELRGQVFADVPRAFARWARQNKEVSIFSSGSVLAQKLLFANSSAGDLTPFIRGYFDTTTGAKNEAESYRRIGMAIGGAPSEIIFLSDVIGELDAAKLAGMETALCARPGQVPLAASSHQVIRSFDEVFP